ncbi:site-2 protease family protein [Candidatus Woesearchaeota archaeon]|nr:site-2 protease family protein [Candidatus Woesearchaeota archaeon]
MGLTEFLIEYKWIILFYLVIALFIYYNRKRFDIHGKIVFLYRTNFGLKFIDNFSTKHKELVKIVGLIGIGVGFIGLIAISALLIQNMFNLLFKPEATPGVGLVIPGVHIPGSPIFVPFWFGIIALFFVVLVHEFGHGIIARAHGLPIKSSGFGLFAIFPIAFVEPDEKLLRKQKDYIQYSTFSAGPFFNVLLSVVAALLLFAVFFPIQEKITEPTGFSISDVQEGYPAEVAGMKGGELIIGINDAETLNVQQFSDEISLIRPGEEITIKTDETTYSIITTEHPDNPRKAYVGILGLTDERRFTGESRVSKFLFDVLLWFKNLLQWVFVLSFGIGLANLLPLGPVDGGRMLQVALHKLYGDKKKGDRLWRQISLLFLFILVINIFFPIIRSIFGSIL